MLREYLRLHKIFFKKLDILGVVDRFKTEDKGFYA